MVRKRDQQEDRDVRYVVYVLTLWTAASLPLGLVVGRLLKLRTA